MSKNEYLDALKKALTGLPPELAAKTMAFYEQRFIDGLAAGRSEEEIAADFDEPRKIAMTLRANAHLGAFQQTRAPVSLLRAIFSFIGLGIFNLFMVVPAAVFSALLLSVYAVAFGLYISGIAVTASGLAGANELVLSGPLSHISVIDDEGEQTDLRTQTRISINERGVQFNQEPVQGPRADVVDKGASKSERLLEGAEAMAGGDVHISSDLDNQSRALQTAVGIGLVLLGIMLSLFSIVVTRYSLIGLKRYLQMNIALLNGR